MKVGNKEIGNGGRGCCPGVKKKNNEKNKQNKAHQHTCKSWIPRIFRQKI